ncbi:MAG: sulfotransferase [Acidobacteria bacterium]|jgi:hypothetical protein|nr:sulfotransferase [Acidobacteriota bacterium]
MKEIEILDRTIFIGGPPRGGTTFAAKSLNIHPGIVAAIDDHVYECWGLYYYRNRIGLVQDLRTRQVSTEEVKESLKKHLIVGNRLIGAAPSPKILGCSQLEKIESPYPNSIRSVLDNNLGRHAVPLDQFSDAWRLCLKSPEISFVLPQLASHFQSSKFVLVYRPINEIAESMYRLGSTVKRFPIFYKRWLEEKDELGNLIPPPGVPNEWNNLWQKVSDFQRCVIYAASYIRGIIDGVNRISTGRFLIYNHAQLRNSPQAIYERLANFLNVDASGFHPAVTELKTNSPIIEKKLAKEYDKISGKLGIKTLMAKIEALQ